MISVLTMPEFDESIAERLASGGVDDTDVQDQLDTTVRSCKSIASFKG